MSSATAVTAKPASANATVLDRPGPGFARFTTKLNAPWVVQNDVPPPGMTFPGNGAGLVAQSLSTVVDPLGTHPTAGVVARTPTVTFESALSALTLFLDELASFSTIWASSPGSAVPSGVAAQ